MNVKDVVKWKGRASFSIEKTWAKILISLFCVTYRVKEVLDIFFVNEKFNTKPNKNVAGIFICLQINLFWWQRCESTQIFTCSQEENSSDFTHMLCTQLVYLFTTLHLVAGTKMTSKYLESTLNMFPTSFMVMMNWRGLRTTRPPTSMNTGPWSF